MFAPLLAKLDMILEAGDDKVKRLASEAKMMVEAMMAKHPAAGTTAKDDAPATTPKVDPAVVSAVATPGASAPADVVAAEVSKQLTVILDKFPTLRKGLAPVKNKGGNGKQTDEEEVIKTFDNLDPGDKLRALLTVEHGKDS